MGNEINHYKTLCEGLEKIVYNSVSSKLASFKGFTESLERNKKSTLENFPLLIYIIDSLQADCVITICKITEGERSHKTIQKFINFISSNLKKLNKEYSELTAELIDEHKNSLKEIEPQINRIKKQRDKYFAHSDNMYFLEPRQLRIDYPNTYEDLTDIIRTLQNLIASHSMIICKSMRIDMSGFVYSDTYKTIEMLEKANNLHNENLKT